MPSGPDPSTWELHVWRALAIELFKALAKATRIDGFGVDTDPSLPRQGVTLTMRPRTATLTLDDPDQGSEPVSFSETEQATAGPGEEQRFPPKWKFAGHLERGDRFYLPEDKDKPLARVVEAADIRRGPHGLNGFALTTPERVLVIDDATGEVHGLAVDEPVRLCHDEWATRGVTRSTGRQRASASRTTGP